MLGLQCILGKQFRELVLLASIYYPFTKLIGSEKLRNIFLILLFCNKIWQ